MSIGILFVCLKVRTFRQNGTSGLRTVCSLTHFLTPGLPALPPQSDTPSPGLSLSAAPPSRSWTGLDLLGKGSYIAAPSETNSYSTILTVLSPLPSAGHTATFGDLPHDGGGRV